MTSILSLFFTDFPMKVCFSSEIESPDHVFATVGNKLSIRFYRNRGYSMAAGFRLVFTSFRDGKKHILNIDLFLYFYL